MKAKKLKGFMVLPAVLMSILLGLIGVSFLQIYSGQFSALSSNRKAIQAAQFAQSEADYLRNVDYSSVASSAHARTAISGATGWQSQVSIGGETTVSGVKQRMATVNVYRNSTVTTPDFSLQVPLSSAGSGDNFPVGTILPYIGSIANIPKKWALCNGSNGTPDLTGRFLEGVTSASAAKKTKSGGFPNIKGKIGAFDTWLMFKGGHRGISGAFYAGPSLGSLNGEGISCGGADGFIDVYFDASKYNPIFRDDVTKVQPDSYTVLYIMKIKA